MTVSVTSFGFKYGIPIDADLVFDVRFLPNPYYIAELKECTGLEEAVPGLPLWLPADHGVYAASGRALRFPAAPVRGGGEVLPGHRRGLHRGTPPLGGPLPTP